MAAPLVKINGKLYSIDSLVGKQVFAAKQTYLYRNTSSQDLAAPAFVVAKGGNLGVIYSYVTAGGKVYLMFNTTSPAILAKYPAGSYYVPIEAIDENTLQQQGTKTYEQEKKAAEEKAAEENKSTTDKALDRVQTIVLTGVGIFVVGSIIKSLLGGKN